MNVTQRLHLDHTDAAAKQLGLPGDRLCHATCNEGRGGELGQAIMRVQTAGQPARKPEPEPKPLTEDEARRLALSVDLPRHQSRPGVSLVLLPRLERWPDALPDLYGPFPRLRGAWP